MAPTTVAAWEPFPIQNAKSPPLYLQRHFTQTSYTIYLTDLTSIWAESLEKGSICDRAEDRNCSIDPSTDDSQLHILLEKLAAGITGINPAVTVELEVRGDTFNVNTKEKLQAPLQPLEWRFRLKFQSAATFTRHFSLPLLYYSSLLSRQTNSLLTIIEEKDVVISRLLDKFEEYKFDMSSIFPGYKKGRTPSGKAKGIIPFDRDSWRDNLQSAEFDSKASKELVLTTFYQLARKNDKVEVPLPKSAEAQWWTKLSGKTTVKGEPEPERTPFTTPKKPPKPVVRLNTDSDDDFQALPSSPTRATAADASTLNPPHIKTAIDDETTEDEDDLSVAPKSHASRSTSNKSSQNTPPPARRSASPRRSEPQDTASPDPAIKKELDRKQKFEDNFGHSLSILDALVEYDETTSESEDEEPQPKKVALTAPKTGGIKKTIGGRKQQQEPAKPAKAASDEDNKPTPAPKAEAEPEPPKRLGKIKGTIGSRKPGSEPVKRKEPEPDSDEEMVDADQEAPKPPPKKKEKAKTPPIQGMDEDAAQKRREELQKQLASKAGTKKRGRKF